MELSHYALILSFLKQMLLHCIITPVILSEHLMVWILFI